MEARSNEKGLKDDIIKFRYPKILGEVSKIKGEETQARGVLDGGAFVGVEINAKRAKFNFYAAGRLYHDDKKNTELEEPHQFEETFEIEARDVKKMDENDNICDEFLALKQLVDDNEHFKRDNDNERIQDLLGKGKESSSDSILLVLRPVTEGNDQKDSELFAVIGGANDGKAK
uniref:Uncharacterized protein n=1 Tax=Globodera pallida TaxID=36090 RepID=A0A183C9S8_GLOPA